MNWLCVCYFIWFYSKMEITQMVVVAVMLLAVQVNANTCHEGEIPWDCKILLCLFTCMCTWEHFHIIFNVMIRKML